MYSKEQIVELKSLINYKEFYSKYFDLPQDYGKVFVPCVFHPESKPSFQIDLEQGVWRCWGESIGGDVFTFYSKYHGVNFTQAVEDLAEQVGYELELDEEAKKIFAEKKEIYKRLENACKNYQRQLESDPQALEYLEMRGFTEDTITNWRLGKGFSVPEQFKEKYQSMGLVNENGFSYMGKNRITIPRIGENGKVLSFTGRLFDDSDNCKYMHAKDTSVYKKGEFVFGLYQAKKYIEHYNQVVLVEGELDTIKCHQNGVKNVVTISGTNFNEYQVNLLKKYTKNFVIWVEDDAMLRPNQHKSNDTDDSVQNARCPLEKIYRLIKSCSPYASVKIVDARVDGQKCDPDEFFKTNKKSDFLNLVKGAKPYYQFILDERMKKIIVKDVDDQKSALSFIIPLLEQIENFQERGHYITLVANRVGVAENKIYYYLKVRAKYNSTHVAPTVYDSRPVYCQKMIISMCMAQNLRPVSVISKVRVKVYEFMSKFYKDIFDTISKYILINKDTDGNIDFSEFFASLDFNGNLNDSNLTQIEIETIRDCWLKCEQLEEFTPNEVDELIEEQLETLTQWSVPVA